MAMQIALYKNRNADRTADEDQPEDRPAIGQKKAANRACQSIYGSRSQLQRSKFNTRCCHFNWFDNYRCPFTVRPIDFDF